MANIKDVARECGVSPTTVSFVLNNTGSVGAGTRERVLGTAKRLGYHPSAIARGLLHKRMNTVGVVFPSPDTAPISNPYFAPILDGITIAATRHHQNAMLFTGQAWSDARHSLPYFSDGRCDGLILVGLHTMTDIVPSLLERGVPFVQINNRWDDPRASFVDVDDVESAFELTNFLLAQGHRRIALFNGSSLADCVGRREEGYRRALEAVGRYDTSLIYPGEFFEPTISERAATLLARPSATRPTAIVTTSDSMALVLLDTLKTLGMHVPQDISLVGFDDIAPSAHSDPPLTTMRQPFHLLGERAVEILLALVSGAPACREVFPTELIERGSVKILPLPSEVKPGFISTSCA